MLVLARKESERIFIGRSIILTVVKVQGTVVRLGIEAPPEIDIIREELIHGGKQAANDGAV